MRLIKGDTFRQAIQRFHAPSEPGASAPGGRRPVAFEGVVFRQLLRRFIDVCNAVAYAHSRGVLHRDLKPGNVMLGKYGETLVVDWGLAKVAGRAPAGPAGGDETEATLRPRSAGESSATVAGRALGTPGYMSPEQAAGRLDQLGPATDVYSLGATLYELLTGRVPFPEVDLEAVEQGRFPPPRQINARVPRPLEAVCRKAMALKPADRYASALALASDIEHWLADEPVSAYPEPAGARVRRWVRRHARLVTGVTAALAVGVAALGGLAWQREQARRAVAHEQAETAKERDAKEVARAAAVMANDQAQARLKQVDRANEILGSVFVDLNPKTTEKEGKPLQAVLGERLDRATAAIEGEAIGGALAVARMQMALGSSQRGLGYPDKAIRLFTLARATFAAQLGPDHPDTLRSMDNLATSYQDAGRLGETLPLLEETLKLRTAQLGPDHPDTLTSMNNLATSYQAAGKFDRALPLFEEVLQPLKARLGPDHPDTLSSMNNLALGYYEAGKFDRALPLFEEVLQPLKARLGPDHPLTLTSMNNLAAGYHAAGKPDLALPLLEATLKLCKARLGPDHPDTLGSMNSLAVGYHAAGKLDLALPLHEEALRLKKAKLGPDHPSTLTSMNNLAKGYRDIGRLDAALPLYEEAARGIEQRRFQHDQAGSIIANTAACLERLRQFEAAEVWRRKWLAVVKERAGPDAPAYATELAGLGDNLLHQHKWPDAEPLLRECLAIREKKQPDAWTTFNTQSLLGGSLHGQQKPADAEALLLAGFAGMKQRAATIPPQARPRLAEVAERLVQLYEATGKPAEAAKWRAELADVQWAIADCPPKP
jgi:tetratricopeptide (TPR) repeat protein